MVRISWKLFKMAFPYVCDACGSFLHEKRDICEYCGKKFRIRKVEKKDNKKRMY